MKKTVMQELVLLKELKTKKKVTLNETIELLSISESTARRIFARLEEKGECIRGYGSISLFNPNENTAYNFESVESVRIGQKEKISKEAVKLVESNDVIFLDSGTTVSHFVLALSQILEQKKLSNITIFTNSLVNLNNLHKYVTVNLIGGKYRDNRKDFCGYIAEEAINGLHFTKCFLGTDGYSKEVGFTTTDFNTARLSKLAISNSEKSIILMDSSKFNNLSLVGFAKSGSISTVITDDEVTDENKKTILSAGISIIIAE